MPATEPDALREQLLRASGADSVFIETGSIADAVRKQFPEGVDKVLELVGTTTLLDSLLCAKEGGTVCVTGIVGNKWSFDDFSPMDAIPTAVNLTAYAGEVKDFMSTPLQELADQVAAGTLRVSVGKVLRLEEIGEAHRAMEANNVGGKIVVDLACRASRSLHRPLNCAMLQGPNGARSRPPVSSLAESNLFMKEFSRSRREKLCASREG